MSSSSIVRMAALGSPAAFRERAWALGLELPCDEAILAADSSPLAKPVEDLAVNGKQIGNRWCIQPMEGWDGTTDGRPTPDTLRRWQRFGESGAKLIFGGEAMAVRPDGRANPNQLVLSESNLAALAALRAALVEAHRQRHGTVEDLVVGFQLTHSGRFCRPRVADQAEPRIAFRHPLLDRRVGVADDRAVLSDEELRDLVEAYVAAARVAWKAGADFVDVKHCHGYLLHEVLGAHTRPGRYGGRFENRTRLLREIVEGIRASGNPIGLAVRLSAFDFVPYRPDPERSTPGRPGPGIPEDFSRCLPYRYGFGVREAHPVEADWAEPVEFLNLCVRLGIRLVNLSAGSPYYNPHIQRPAMYPPSDGYQPPEDPLVGVARQVGAVRELKRQAARGLVLVGSAYTYLQEYLPHVAQALVRMGWVDVIGIGRMALSYPTLPGDTLRLGRLNPRELCRTFSDCTTAPRNGLVSGCYPLDPYYAAKPEAEALKNRKRRGDAPGRRAAR